MTQVGVPMVILSRREEQVENVNKILRDGGHPARCHWISDVNDLFDAIDRHTPEILWFFPEGFDIDIQKVSDIRRGIDAAVPLLVVQESVDEVTIADAMEAGAQDVVSVDHSQRLLSVAAREMRAYRLERALNETLSSATQYKQQLKAFMAGTDDALAIVQEGILVDANQPWADLFGFPNSDDMVGNPLMDFFDHTSQTPLKGALVACYKGRWDADSLRLLATRRDGKAVNVELWVSATTFEDEPAVQLSTPLQPAVEQEPAERVEAAVNKDPVTGIYHRHYFLKELERRIKAERRSGVRAFAYLRPDKFDALKDEVGPLASEEILVQLAGIVASLAAPNDLYGRFGGTDFTLLLERGTIRDVEAWADNLVKTISNHIFEITGQSISLTCTVGIAEVTADLGDLNRLINDAETALKRGRQRGGNEVVLEETSDVDTRTQRYDEIWVRHIKSALMENRFKLLHLPIASLTGESTDLFDTLVRMLDEQRNDVLPGDFMPAAARNQLTKNIDRWVIGASMSYCATRKPGCIFIRLSSESILDSTLVDWLQIQLDTHKVSPEKVCFQVAEEDANHHLKETKVLVERIRAMGMSFAVEHFGLGRDPVRMLGHLPMDYIKIDGSLMQGLSSNEVLQDRVKQLVAAAHAKRIDTIAERVEDANTMAVLFQLGVSFMQGHYVQEPEVVLQG